MIRCRGTANTIHCAYAHHESPIVHPLRLRTFGVALYRFEFGDTSVDAFDAAHAFSAISAGGHGGGDQFCRIFGIIFHLEFREG